MNGLGYSCRINTTRAIADVHPPAILFAHVGTIPHAVAFMGLSHGQAEIPDPMRGRRLMTEIELDKIWDGNAVEIDMP